MGQFRGNNVLPTPICWRSAICRAWVFLSQLFFPEVSEVLLIFLSHYQQICLDRATYQNIRKLCSGVFSKKQTLQFSLRQIFDHVARDSDLRYHNQTAFLSKYKFSLLTELEDSIIIYPSVNVH